MIKKFLVVLLLTGLTYHQSLTAQPSSEPPTNSALVVRGIKQKNLWEQTMFLALQGLANRQGPKIYMFLNGRNDRVWLDWYKRRYQLETEPLDDPYKLFNYDWPIKGYILMDPDAKHTANLAINYASALNLLPVTKNILDKHRKHMPDLDVRMDLTDRFKTASAHDVYRWAAGNQWNKLQYNKKYVANCMAPDSEKKPFFQTQHIRDFIVAKHGFVFALSSNKKKHPEEYRLKDQYLSDMTDWGYLFGWHVQRAREAQHVEQATRNKQMVLCSNTSSNFSFHQHMAPANPDYHQQHQRQKLDQVKLRKNKIYLTFYFSDGDSLNWVSRGAHGRRWMNRGKIPMGWEIQPLLHKFAPGMLDYFYQTATKKDVLIASATGLGYTHPSIFPDQSLKYYLRMTRKYLRKLDLRLLIALTNHAYRPGGVKQNIRETYGQMLGDTLMGVFEGYTMVRSEREVHDQLVWMPTLLPHTARRKRAPSYQNFTEIVEQNPQRPLFVPFHVNKGHMTYKETVQFVETAREKYGDQLNVVTPDEFILAYIRSEIKNLNQPVKMNITTTR